MSDKKDVENTSPQTKKGIKQPAKLNPNLANLRRKARKSELSVTDFVEGIQKGDRVRLGQAITLIESTQSNHLAKAQEIIAACLPSSGKSIRIGITGTPGVGKSTFIESFGLHLIQKAKRTAILAIDPSSQVSKGSILGDKTRMAELSQKSEAFIRPSPAGSSLGGVARKTRETIILCEAAGYDTIIVETVGVGQSEVAVHSMVDFFLLLLLPGAGDELQGIKRGVVEMADLLAVNKADGNRLALAKQTRQAYRNALHLFPLKKNKWSPKVLSCSAVERAGMDDIWKTILKFEQQMKESHFFEMNRQEQAKYWFQESIQQQLGQLLHNHPQVKQQLAILEREVATGKKSPFSAAEELIQIFVRES
ncbi:MAG: methylmalonyl Co-A mutase-associated GTPase MeaB [Saprospiraceae bacterium]|nr:methylmalonyl Co-A mutase-associated GTPase MeaB [Saprospiraceae bacterium]